MNRNQFNRDSGKPLYLQLKEQLTLLIQQGKWSEGSLIPTEMEMKQEYGISRATVRQALNELEDEGIIERRRGVGTIICHQRIKPELMKLTSFSEDMRSRGLIPGSKTIDVEFTVPSSKVRESFNIETDEKVWRVCRLRLASDEPFGIHDLYLPPALSFSPRELNNISSYYQLLEEKHGLKPAHASETLTASIANKAEASLLKISEGAPLLVIWRNTYTEENQIIESVKVIYRADRYEYHIQLYV